MWPLWGDAARVSPLTLIVSPQNLTPDGIWLKISNLVRKTVVEPYEALSAYYLPVAAFVRADPLEKVLLLKRLDISIYSLDRYSYPFG